MTKYSFLVLTFVCLTIGLNAQTWETNYEEAVAKAKEENKTLFLNFTGSDWCGWCIKLDREVFSQPDFVDYAEDNLVLVKLDFPRRKKLSKEEQMQNQKLASKYGVRGFPTVYLISPEEETILKTGYQRGGAKNYVAHLDANISK